MNFSTIEINRFTIHRIIGKKELKDVKGGEPHAEQATDFCKLGTDGIATLEERIVKATQQRKRFFELSIEDAGAESFFDMAKILFGLKKKDYLEQANKIADKAAAAHDRGNIPGGVLLIAEAVIDASNALIVIKAEKSDAFSMNGSNVELIKDIFLSSDKALYKIGFLVRVDQKNVSKRAFRAFVYDDSFSPIKDDLAYYFYNSFLGLSTEENSKIQTNNFYKYVKDFTNEFVDGFDSQLHVMKIVDHDMVTKEKKIIHPEEYAEVYPKEIRPIFEEMVINRLPAAIIKDTSVLSDIHTKRIKINESAVLIAKNGLGSQIMIMDGNDPKYESTRKSVIDSGKELIHVLIPKNVQHIG